MRVSDNTILREGLRELQRRLPPGWTVSESPALDRSFADAVVEITAPDRRTGSLFVEVRPRLTPNEVLRVFNSTKVAGLQNTFVVVARYLSEGTRSRLRAAKLGYLDLTGNAWIVVPEPGLFIETQGASENPNRDERKARSLRGPKAGRIVRALIDRATPPGVRELAAMTKIDAGYVSRVLAFLESEALVTRVGHGRMQSVDWPALLRHWAQEAPLESRGETQPFLEPRGLPALIGRLGKSGERYVVSGGLAAAALAPVAPARLGLIWIRDAAVAATKLNLRSAETGANVLLVEPNDEGVFEGSVKRDGISYAAPSQVAVDLLTSPGRGPAEGEELISWMRANEAKWRQ